MSHAEVSAKTRANVSKPFEELAEAIVADGALLKNVMDRADELRTGRARTGVGGGRGGGRVVIGGYPSGGDVFGEDEGCAC